MSRARVLLVLLVALGLAAPALPARAGAFPGPNGKIVYVADGDVFVADADGTGVTNVTQRDGLDAENVSASPDGKRIAFGVGSSSVLDERGLYVVDAGGNTLRDVLRGRHDDFIHVAAPTWSPDGRRLAFEGYSYPGLKNELFVVDADGSNLRKLTNCDCVSVSYPAWSPAGPQIAVVPCCGQVVMTVDADTRATAEVFAAETGQVSDLTWSPDGTQLAYDDLIEVYRVSIPDGTPVPLTASGPGYYSDPSWSPDGTQILVESNHESPESTNRDLYAIDAVDGVDGGLTRITRTSVDEWQPEWAPACEAQCTVPSMTLRIVKRKRALRVKGSISPAPRGAAKVTLLRKTSRGFKRAGRTAAGIRADGRFTASFERPPKGRCRVVARYAGDAEHEPALARKTFAC